MEIAKSLQLQNMTFMTANSVDSGLAFCDCPNIMGSVRSV